MSIVRKYIKSVIAFALAGSALVSTASAADTIWDCKPTEVYEFPGARIHVTCATPFNATIKYGSIPVTDAALAARLVSLASSAMLSGTTFRMVVDPSNTSDLPSGCGSSDCRRIHHFGLR